MVNGVARSNFIFLVGGDGLVMGVSLQHFGGSVSLSGYICLVLMNFGANMG